MAGSKSPLLAQRTREKWGTRQRRLRHQLQLLFYFYFYFYTNTTNFNINDKSGGQECPPHMGRKIQIHDIALTTEGGRAA